MRLALLLALVPSLALGNSLYDNTPTYFGDPIVVQPSTWNGSDLNAASFTTTTTTVGGSPTGGTDTALTAWTGIAFASTSTTLGQVSIRLKKGSGVADGGTIAAYLFTNNAGVPGSDISTTNTGLPSTTGLPTIVTTTALGTSYANFNFQIPQVNVTPATVYWVVLKASVSGGTVYVDSAAAGGNYLATAADSSGSPGAWTGAAKTGAMVVYGSSGTSVYATSPTGHSIQAWSDSGVTIYSNVKFGGIAIKGDAQDDGIGVGGTSPNGTGVRGSSANGFAGQFVADGANGTGAQVIGPMGMQVVASDAAKPAIQLVHSAGGNVWQTLDAQASYAVSSQIDGHGNAYMAGSWLGAATALGTCGSTTDPVHTFRFVAGSGSTPSRVCYCQFTPTGSVYAWVRWGMNSGGTGIGTTTTCP
jgi:hypothetical protein